MDEVSIGEAHPGYTIFFGTDRIVLSVKTKHAGDGKLNGCGWSHLYCDRGSDKMFKSFHEIL